MNTSFVSQNNLLPQPLQQAIQCVGFTGKKDGSGIVTSAWEGRVGIAREDVACECLPIDLKILPLGGQDVILGLPWLAQIKAWITCGEDC